MEKIRQALPAALAHQALHARGWERQDMPCAYCGAHTGGGLWERGNTTWSHKDHPLGKVHVYPDGGWYHVQLADGGGTSRVMGKGTGYQSLRDYLLEVRRS
jgi:hypothetical protein